MQCNSLNDLQTHPPIMIRTCPESGFIAFLWFASFINRWKPSPVFKVNHVSFGVFPVDYRIFKIFFISVVHFLGFAYARPSSKISFTGSKELRNVLTNSESSMNQRKDEHSLNIIPGYIVLILWKI